MAPRTWIQVVNDAAIAPNATPTERLLGYGSGIFGAVFAGALATNANLSGWITAIFIVLGFDLFGGVVVNATASGSRRFHAPGTPRWRALRFVAFHIHPLALAFLLPEMPWTTAIVAYAGVVFATVVVLLVPDRNRQPAAFTFGAILIGVCTAALPPDTVVSWVVPLLVVKLLLAHLLPHPPAITQRQGEDRA